MTIRYPHYILLSVSFFIFLSLLFSLIILPPQNVNCPPKPNPYSIPPCPYPVASPLPSSSVHPFRSLLGDAVRAARTHRPQLPHLPQRQRLARRDDDASVRPLEGRHPLKALRRRRRWWTRRPLHALRSRQLSRRRRRRRRGAAVGRLLLLLLLLCPDGRRALRQAVAKVDALLAASVEGICKRFVCIHIEDFKAPV